MLHSFPLRSGAAGVDARSLRADIALNTAPSTRARKSFDDSPRHLEVSGIDLSRLRHFHQFANPQLKLVDAMQSETALIISSAFQQMEPMIGSRALPLK